MNMIENHEPNLIARTKSLKRADDKAVSSHANYQKATGIDLPGISRDE